MTKIDLADRHIDDNAVGLLGHFYCEKYAALPVKLENGRLFVAINEPDPRVIADISDISGCFVEPVPADSQDILFHINTIFGQEQRRRFAAEHSKTIKTASDGNEFLDDEYLNDAPAVRFVNSLIETGVLNRATDIHIEPYENKLRARFRIDGRLITKTQVDLSILPNAISRLKIMSGIDISEKRLPQDGHFTQNVHGEEIEFRLSTLPTFYGEKVAIRLLYEQASRFKKDALGFFPDDISVLDRLFGQPYGAIFMTGPTGSGKSTTLNSFLAELSTEDINVVTVEDPVENPLPGVNHMSANPYYGLTFANALRHILRQDPDIIMIGEIRDAETARIAIQAAITGHLVLSTLHTNDAAGVLERLTDMGVEPYLAAAALNGIISQRLVRRICPYCKTETALSPEQAEILRISAESKVYFGSGCAKCGGTGYKGRLAVYEYLIINEELRRRMSGNPTGFAAGIRKQNGGGLRANALRNLQAGNTDAKEIIRVLSRDN